MQSTDTEVPLKFVKEYLTKFRAAVMIQDLFFVNENSPQQPVP